MKKRIIRFCYRKVIDHASQKAWDKYVFESSYQEYLMQVQFYDREKKYPAFADLLQKLPAAGKLHFLVSASVTGYVQQLNGAIPDILNNLGRHFLKFTDYKFEIINSDMKNKTAHRIGIQFFSEPMIWHDTVGDQMLVSVLDNENYKDGALTDLVRLQPFLSIYSLTTSQE
jgi:hypothetical protein